MIVKSIRPLPAKKGFTFGCDPEGFIFKGDTPVPAVGIIPGTKDEPYKVKKGWVQVDGMAAEFNTEPAKTHEEWEENITTVMKELEGFLPKGHEIRYIPSVVFEPSVFDSAPEYAKALGCQPDFDAWSGGVNPPPNPENPLLRCAGGHLHAGWTKNADLSDIQHILNCQDLVKQYDWVLGGWSVQHDSDTNRRTLYGKLGACRYKPYGVEYRVLSNFWVTDEKLRLEVWNRMNHGIYMMPELFLPDRTPTLLNTELKKYVNNEPISKDLLNLCHYPLVTMNSRNFQF